MSRIFKIKRKNTSPNIKYDVFPRSLILTGATIRFKMKNARGETVLDAPGVVLTPTENPSIGYEWQDGDTDAIGDYKAEFDVHLADGGLVTIPNDHFLIVSIGPNVPDKDEA